MRVFAALTVITLAGCLLDRSGLGPIASEPLPEGGGGAMSTGGGEGGSPTPEGGFGGRSGEGGDGGVGGAPPLDPCAESGVVLCYRFEGNVDDGSPGAHHGTATGISYVPGRVGQALHHDVGSLVVVPAEPLALGELTVEVWVRPTSVPSSGRRAVLDHDGRIGMFILGGGVMQCRAGSLVAGSSLPTNEWTHVACTFSGSSIEIYLDGQLDTEGGNGPLDATPSIAHLGSNVPTGDELAGDLDDFRVFSHVRTAAEICQAAGASCPPRATSLAFPNL